jgi:hypothetical protein
MINVYLLKQYNNHGEAEIITVEETVADTLVRQGFARLCTNRDFIIKPKFGSTKAFKKSPISK